jgi:proteasome accessory factor B
MPKFKPQYRRLLFIDKRLREGRYPNCSTLAAEWEVSAKTIMRDIDYLRDELDAPIEYDAVQHGYYYAEASYRLPAITISESDLFAVCIAEKALQQFRKTPLHSRLASVFEKIEQSLPDHVSVQPAWVDSRISIFPDAATTIDPDVWDTTARALRENRRTRLRHQSPGRDRPINHDVAPYHLVGYKGEWYLIGYSQAHGEVRTFALSRVRSVELLDDTCEVPEDFDLDSLTGDHFGIMWGTRTYQVRVRFDAKVAPYIREREWHSKQKLTQSRDGSVVLGFPTSHLNEVKDWILSWGPGATALAPKSLVARIRSDLRESLKNYPKG